MILPNGIGFMIVLLAIGLTMGIKKLYHIHDEKRKKNNNF
tara:strand:+ start:1043 stop:1162 length:120 start_codon:yes stop_codon:yes gene_type:complete